MTLPDQVESRETIISGHRVHYLKTGNGPAVVLLHGAGGDSRDWPEFMANLADRYTLYAPDIIGFGRSQRKKSGYYFPEFLDFLEEFVTAMNTAPCFLIGHSFGGRLALGLALKRPDMVRSMVLVDTAGLGKISLSGVILTNFFNCMRALLRKPQPAPNVIIPDGEDPHLACVEALPGLKAPVLLVWKRHDPYLPLANARRAVQLIPDARLKIFPGIGHAPHRRYHEEFKRLVTEFFQGNIQERGILPTTLEAVK